MRHSQRTICADAPAAGVVVATASASEVMLNDSRIEGYRRAIAYLPWLRVRTRKLRSCLAILGSVLGLFGQANAGHYEMKPLDPPSFPKNPYGGIIHWDENSGAYGGDENGYWHGIAGATYVLCEGTITTVYVWVRDQIADPLDPEHMIDDPSDDPPEQVISQEYCLATAVAFSNAGNASADTDNGLGFDPLTYGDPFSIGSYCEGTLYTKRPGGEEITLACTPNALAESDDSDATASVSYRSSIIVPTVMLEGATQFTSPRDLKFLTGQQITGSIAQLIAGSVTGSGPPISTYKWGTGSAPGSDDDVGLFKSYTYTTASGKVNMHSRSDVVLPSYSFFTVKDGSIIVTCDLAFAPETEDVKYTGAVLSFTAKSYPITSVRPDHNLGNVTTGLVTLFPNAFVFGNFPAQKGQVWSGVTFDPAPFSGQGDGCFAQLITADRSLYRNTTPPHYSHFVYQRSGALDAAFPYPWAPWSMPGPGTFEDTPSQSLTWNPNDGGGADWYHARANDSFETWAMFRPPSVLGHPTTWVPMLRYTWQWYGTAEKQGGQWNLAPKGGGVISPPTSVFDHPQWNTFSPGTFYPWGVN